VFEGRRAQSLLGRIPAARVTRETDYPDPSRKTASCASAKHAQGENERTLDQVVAGFFIMTKNVPMPYPHGYPVEPSLPNSKSLLNSLDAELLPNVGCSSKCPGKLFSIGKFLLDRQVPRFAFDYERTCRQTPRNFGPMPKGTTHFRISSIAQG
jgi:hypothetical protein